MAYWLGARIIKPVAQGNSGMRDRILRHVRWSGQAPPCPETLAALWAIRAGIPEAQVPLYTIERYRRIYPCQRRRVAMRVPILRRLVFLYKATPQEIMAVTSDASGRPVFQDLLRLPNGQTMRIPDDEMREFLDVVASGEFDETRTQKRRRKDRQRAMQREKNCAMLKEGDAVEHPTLGRVCIQMLDLARGEGLIEWPFGTVRFNLGDVSPA